MSPIEGELKAFVNTFPFLNDLIELGFSMEEAGA